MMKYILAFDLGTGGTKASLFDTKGQSLQNHFVSCQTYFPEDGFHEQNPDEWWSSVVDSTKELLKKVNVDKNDIAAISVSGHSLGIVPVGEEGLLLDRVPIWSDSRGTAYAEEFFKSIPEEEWYMTTGNGFPAGLYSIFKLMWLKEHNFTVYNQAKKFIGTKDYVNYKLTGELVTDYSYASGCGAYNLKESRYEQSFIDASGISGDKFPHILASTDVVGTVLPEIAEQLGLSVETKVVAGGVDNTCMAIGAGANEDGESYTSLGTSSWIAVTSSDPIVDMKNKPYVFAHADTGKYVSATAIFSAGNSYRWIKNNICLNLTDDPFEQMNELAATSKRGANNLFFNPSLAGGSSIDETINMKGGFVGLTLGHTQADLIRAALEGITLNLSIALEALESYVPLADEMLIVGGGANSDFWMSLFANIYNKKIIKSNVGQDAGSLGAAALALVGLGIWDDFSPIKDVHKVEKEFVQNIDDVEFYNEKRKVFRKISSYLAKMSELII